MCRFIAAGQLGTGGWAGKVGCVCSLAGEAVSLTESGAGEGVQAGYCVESNYLSTG